MKRCLVTHAESHAGRVLARTIREKGRPVTALVESEETEKELAGFGIQTIRGHWTDSSVTAMALKDCGTVFHTAGPLQADVGEIPKAMENLKGLLKASKEAGAAPFVHLGSIASVGYSEDALKHLSEKSWAGNPLAEPFKAELYLERTAHCMAEGLNLDFRVGLAGFTFGPNCVRKNKVITLLTEFLEWGLPGNLRGGFNMADVRDVAAGLIQIEEKGEPANRYFLGGDNITFRRMYEIVSDRCGLPRIDNYLSTDPEEAFAELTAFRNGRTEEGLLYDPNAVADLCTHFHYIKGTKSKHALNYTYRTKEDVIVDTVKWFVENNRLAGDRKKQIRFKEKPKVLPIHF